MNVLVFSVVYQFINQPSFFLYNRHDYMAVCITTHYATLSPVPTPTYSYFLLEYGEETQPTVFYSNVP